jgi:hypothetical protein
MADKATDNVNFLSPLNFKVVVGRIPNVEYFCIGVTVPAMQLTPAEYATPGRTLHMYSDKLNFTELIVQVVIDEDLENYKEMLDWTKEIVYNSDKEPLKKSSDITVMILSSHNNTVRKIRFTDAWPTSIGDLTFSSTTPDVEYVIATMTFAFTDMVLE